MRFRSYTYLLATIAVLSACQKEEPVYTVGEADNVISLSAGAYEGESDMATKAVPVEDDTRHGKHLALAEGIKLRLQVNGTWTGKSDISKTTTATIGAENGTTKHNGVTFTDAEKLYWDDYGTADPANAGTGNGREKGLTIYGVAVNDKNVSAQPETINWGSFDWSVSANQTDGWSAKDLIISNNLQTGTGYDGTLTFDDFKKKLAGTSGYENAGLLEFKHAMSKITINLTANKGFVDSKFVGEPTVALHGFYTSGKVNITSGALTGQTGNVDNNSDPTDIQTYCETATKTGQTNITRSALVFPGRTLLSTDHIATVTADGNIYKITAEKILAAMTAANHGSEMKSGYNYILNIKVDKTEVKVSATVVDWIGVEAAEDTPKIDINTSYGEDGGGFNRDFSFYYSKNKQYGGGTGEDFYGTGPVSDFYGADRTVNYSSGKYTFNTDLYWPDHTTKYFFRGIWPKTSTTDSDGKPKVAVFNNGTRNCQGIPVSNAKFDSDAANGGKHPSDLMLGIPLRKDETTDKKTEPTLGIGATEGTISLTFKYMMAQVEVRLMSSGRDNADNIDFGSTSTGGAQQANVSIVNAYNDAYVLLSDGSVATASGTNKGDYEMNAKSTTLPSESMTSSEYAALTDWSTKEYLVRHDAIIPQKLDDATPVKFQVVTGPAGNKDTYTIDVKDIVVSSINNIAQPAGTKITEWEAGKHYIYTLKITKTQVKIEATITNWIPVVAGGDFWL